MGVAWRDITWCGIGVALAWAGFGYHTKKLAHTNGRPPQQPGPNQKKETKSKSNLGGESKGGVDGQQFRDEVLGGTADHGPLEMREVELSKRRL